VDTHHANAPLNAHRETFNPQKRFYNLECYRILGDALNKRKLIILSFSLVCLALIVGGVLYWYSEKWAEQRLEEYIGRLEDLGFTTEEHSLADFYVDAVSRILYFSDFHSYPKQQGISHIYFDRGIHALYFLHPSTENWVEANVFYYK
jgi:hypothetical protein